MEWNEFHLNFPENLPKPVSLPFVSQTSLAVLRGNISVGSFFVFYGLKNSPVKKEFLSQGDFSIKIYVILADG
jgi:hypothetical protein